MNFFSAQVKWCTASGKCFAKCCFGKLSVIFFSLQVKLLKGPERSDKKWRLSQVFWVSLAYWYALSRLIWFFLAKCALWLDFFSFPSVQVKRHSSPGRRWSRDAWAKFSQFHKPVGTLCQGYSEFSWPTGKWVMVPGHNFAQLQNISQVWRFSTDFKLLSHPASPGTLVFPKAG